MNKREPSGRALAADRLKVDDHLWMRCPFDRRRPVRVEPGPRGCRRAAGRSADLAGAADAGQAFTPQPFEQSADAYRAMGREEDARTALLAKQRLCHSTLPWYARIWGTVRLRLGAAGKPESGSI